MWMEELKEGTQSWYQGGAEYWQVDDYKTVPQKVPLQLNLLSLSLCHSRGTLQSQPATDDGVLGGYGHVTGIDIESSAAFLQDALGPFPQDPECRKGFVALDCGAGVGRVSEGLLLQYCARVDLLEQDLTYLDTAKARLGSKNPFGKYLHQGIQDVVPARGLYMLIWVQWVSMYLTGGYIYSSTPNAASCSPRLNSNSMMMHATLQTPT